MFCVLNCLLGLLSYALQKHLFSSAVRSLETNYKDEGFTYKQSRMKVTPSGGPR